MVVALLSVLPSCLCTVCTPLFLRPHPLSLRLPLLVHMDHILTTYTPFLNDCQYKHDVMMPTFQSISRS